MMIDWIKKQDCWIARYEGYTYRIIPQGVCAELQIRSVASTYTEVVFNKYGKSAVQIAKDVAWQMAQY